MVALTQSTPAQPLSLPTLPPPLQPRIPRPPARIIVLCDGTAQQRNWVQTTLNNIPSPAHPHLYTPASFTSSNAAHNSDGSRKLDRGDKGDKKKKSGKAPTPAAETGDFFTNVALLAKCITNSSGAASPSPPSSPGGKEGAEAGVMPQIVFYQSGIGTGGGLIQRLYDQGTGLSLGSKIEEAYCFVVDNYQPGDELFFFGFSRGAYTARCITGLINWCGILTKVEMTHFADIWAAYQRRDPDDIDSETSAAEVLYRATLKYPSAESEQVATNMYYYNLDQNSDLSDDQRKEYRGRRSKECEARREKQLVVPPQIKVVGVWDTVAALGFPGTFQDNDMIEFFDFYDPGLGSNIQFGFHALSLEEDRKDFLPTMWYQPPPSTTSGEVSVRGQHMRSKQVLKQCWFQGVHTDCGGGYQYHGLSDITLIWMVSQLVDPHTLPDGSTTLRPLLNIDVPLLATILDRRREWAKQVPHRSRPSVNYQRNRTVHQRIWDEETMKRTVWKTMAVSGETHESIHASVVRGGRIEPETHPAFKEMRGDAPELLKKLWEEASDWDKALRPTEKQLYWDRREPYPWIPPQGDPNLNPETAPQVLTGGWNFPETASRGLREMVLAASESNDVDDAEEVSGGGGGNGDVDDQPADGWEGLTSSPSKTSVPTTAPAALPASDSTQILPLIPSKELGENPINPSTHPTLYSVWEKIYNFSSTPNALVADICNLRLVTKANLNQTVVQGWWWDLGDRVGGYSDEVKVQALTAGLRRHKHRGHGGGKKRRGKGKDQGHGEEGERHDEL